MNGPRRDSGVVKSGRCICDEGVRLLDSKYGVHRLPLNHIMSKVQADVSC
jgi:hypothetical protein